jgi:pyruvate dehydrogenase E2 component (dihydrolipoamide acetyltransferase)
MTDKATVEIPSPRAGTVTSITGGEGDVIEVGQVFLVIDDGEDGDEVGESTTRLEPGEAADSSSAGAALTEVAAAAEPSPPPAATPAPPKPAAVPTNGSSSTPVSALPQARPEGGKILATPATRRAARELDIDLASVLGTGPQGRVTKADVVAHSEGRRPFAAAGAGGGPGASLGFTHTPVPRGSGPEERVKVRGLRRKISQAMVRSSLTIPHFSYIDEVDMTELVGLRQRVNEQLVADGLSKVSYLPFIMKALWIAFADHPEVNALYDNTTDEVVYKKYFNCGLATDTAQGLFVSVIRDIPGKSIMELGEEIKAVTTRVREGKATREDLSDSTFTITSIGNIGGLFATPIINYPEVAILGFNKIAPRPIVRNGEIVVRQMTHLSPSFDHRVVDGANGARFVSRLKVLLEEPGLILAHM